MVSRGVYIDLYNLIFIIAADFHLSNTLAKSVFGAPLGLDNNSLLHEG